MRRLDRTGRPRPRSRTAPLRPPPLLAVPISEDSRCRDRAVAAAEADHDRSAQRQSRPSDDAELRAWREACPCAIDWARAAHVKSGARKPAPLSARADVHPVSGSRKITKAACCQTGQSFSRRAPRTLGDLHTSDADDAYSLIASASGARRAEPDAGALSENRPAAHAHVWERARGRRTAESDVGRRHCLHELRNRCPAVGLPVKSTCLDSKLGRDLEHLELCFVANDYRPRVVVAAGDRSQSAATTPEARSSTILRRAVMPRRTTPRAGPGTQFFGPFEGELFAVILVRVPDHPVAETWTSPARPAADPVMEMPDVGGQGTRQRKRGPGPSRNRSARREGRGSQWNQIHPRV